MKANLPETGQERIVIIGGGFGGLKLATKLSKLDYQVVLIDKNNYHQFQPLFYQVATAGLEPSSISFPFRKIFQKKNNVFVRVAEVTAINMAEKHLSSSIGDIHYDYLVIATGVDTNFFGNENISKNALPMKSVAEALGIRNRILKNYEDALSVESEEKRQALMNIVVVGGGPTGVEISGTLAEMKRYILPKDYPELDFSKMQIYVLEASPKLLASMSEASSKKAKVYLEKLGVSIMLETRVKDYDSHLVYLENNNFILSETLIWAAGVTGIQIPGLPATVFAQGNRIKVNEYNQLPGYEYIYAVGDIALMSGDEKYPKGHPQLAQVAMQQAENMARNFERKQEKKSLVGFKYKNLGSMATVGKNLAVVDLPFWQFQGFFAWLVWMFVHLMSIIGVKNRLLIFINWVWNYVTYDQSLRLIIKAKKTVD